MRNVLSSAALVCFVAVSACSGGTSAVATPAPPPPAPVPVAPAAPAAPAAAAPAQADTSFVPTVGQEGKDVVWVPTSPELVELMLDLAKVTPQDFVMDLGSGDGRNIIAAAKRGARGVGVEYNPDMVTLSQRLAREAGVADRAQFVQGDMYVADVSKATVLALFLLPQNLDQLKDKFLALPAGTRIVLNTFTYQGWEPAESRRLEDNCSSWCNAILLLVPAQMAGDWQFDGGRLTLTQEFEGLTGTFTPAGAAPLSVTGNVRASEVTLRVDGRTYTGRFDNNRLTGTVTETGGASRAFTATR